ncbi:MAG TPA: iron-containing redox enzyme family protein [Blastocatellia bacterium]|nr:iron-containing redox enzyme family protein [Blastocatellia bacterium]
MSLTTNLRSFVLQHGAINNPYLDRFQRGHLSVEEFEHFAVQFFAFVKHFPRILATLLANTPDDAAADELAIILTSELGDGDPKHRHEYIYHRFLRSIDIEPREAARQPLLDSTRDYIEGLNSLYGHSDYLVALGASFGLEHMAIPMWDQLIPGILEMKQTHSTLAKMHTGYWTFHRALEEKHEEGMMKALDSVDQNAEPRLLEGCCRALDLLEGFWMGLEKSSPRPSAP